MTSYLNAVKQRDFGSANWQLNVDRDLPNGRLRSNVEPHLLYDILAVR
jgi:hypothetical protein